MARFLPLSLLILRDDLSFSLNNISFALIKERPFHLKWISCAISTSGFFLRFFSTDRSHTNWSLQELSA